MIGGLFAAIYFLAVLALIVFMLLLCLRFVRAHERMAGALEAIARHPRPPGV